MKYELVRIARLTTSDHLALDDWHQVKWDVLIKLHAIPRDARVLGWDQYQVQTWAMSTRYIFFCSWKLSVGCPTAGQHLQQTCAHRALMPPKKHLKHIIWHLDAPCTKSRNLWYRAWKMWTYCVETCPERLVEKYEKFHTGFLIRVQQGRKLEQLVARAAWNTSVTMQGMTPFASQPGA